MDIKNLTDEELESSMNDLINEKERRARLSSIPQQIAELSARFIADGGDHNELVTIVG